MIDLYFEIRKRICPFKIIVDYIPPQTKILDLGCGNGIIYKYFLKNSNFISYTGIDNDKKKIKKLQSLNTNKITFLNNNLEEIINIIKNYDCILMIDVMHHLNKKNQKKIIENILKNMKKNSTLIYKDISNKNPIKSLLNRIHDFFFNFQVINYYELKKIISFAKNNLKIKDLKIFIIQVLWYDHEFLIINK